MNKSPSTFARSLFCVLLLSIAAARGEKPPATGGATEEVCRLLTKEEVAAVQGAVINNAQGQVNGEGQFRVTQCFYSAADTSKSISLMLTQSNPGAPAPAAGKARTVAQFWHERFDRFAKKEAESEKEKDSAKKSKDVAAKKERGKKEPKDKGKDAEEEDDDKEPPRRIAGLGDDAYWTRSHVGGTLYVLKGEALLRISVGGPDNEETRLDKSKALAAKALARL